MTFEQAARLFVLLTKYGARPSQFDEWIAYMCDKTSRHWEFRCLASLGFGGKIHWDHHVLRASMYEEDSTPKREQILEEIQIMLHQFQSQFLVETH